MVVDGHPHVIAEERARKSPAQVSRWPPWTRPYGISTRLLDINRV
jgi:hypothetical protein